MIKESVNLNSLCTKIGDGLHGTPIYEENSGYFFINGNNLTGGVIVLSNTTKEVTSSEYSRYFIELDKKTLLLSINGTIGELAFYNDEKIMLGKSVAYLKFKTEINRYYFYYFQAPWVQKHFLNISTGSTIKNLGLVELQNFIVPHPVEEEWRPIVQTLSVLDKKIELNNQINSELEATAKLIYDYWFVQFDFPDENGKPYKSSGGEMVYDEDLKREIPKGWGARRLSDFEPKIITGKTPSTNDKDNFEGDIPFICIGDVRGNMHVTKTEIKLTEVGAASQASKFIPKGAICVTCIASPGLVAFASSESQTNQQINSVVCKRNENRYFLYFYLKDYFNFAKAKTGNTFANMNKDDFSSILLPYPKKEIVDRFSETVKSVFDNVLLNSQESNHLIELRDWLLPMLMNGQVTVSDTSN
ncbi:restriction endonuclease subunit S [Alphaproteobacteria bacterium]|nr:restriction endonuclease subunit S [Alphaproteobacteria bacterium]